MKKVRYLFIALFVILFAVNICLFKYPFMLLYRNLTETKSTQPLYLTTEQKLEDFEYIYEIISTSFPMLDDIKGFYQLDFIADKEKYRQLVIDSKDDYEFFCVINYIMSNLPSAHTDIVFPDYNAYKGLGCYNLKNTLIKKDVASSAYYWNELIKNKLKIYNDAEVEWFIFEYTSGNYLFYGDSDIEVGAEILSIDNMLPEEYIMRNPFIANKRYDFAKSNNYVRKIVLNNCIGVPLNISVKTSCGIKTYVMYHDIYSEMAYYSSLNYIQNENCNNIYYYADDKINTVFIQIDSFDIDIGNEFNAIIDQTSKYDNIIIDFRNNSGGTIKFGTDYLYPKLFSFDTDAKNDWYMLNSKNNQKILNENKIQTIFKHKFKNADDSKLITGKYLSSTRNIKYIGKCDKQKNIYFLISDVTASAADGFISDVKNNDCVTIIGNNNTSGEGLANSFIVDCLPNSKLLFIYMYGKAFNEDGTDNSIYGTSPNHYINDTAKGFVEKSIIMKNNENPYDYENRLKWDNVLIKTIEIIKEKEKAK